MNLGDLWITVGAKIDSYRAAMGEVDSIAARTARTAGAHATGISTSFAQMGARMGSAGAAMSLAISAPLLGLAGTAVAAAGKMEALQKGLTAITGSASETALQLQRLKVVAQLPGLGFQEAVRGSINLQAAGFSANTAERALKSFGNALATVGKGKAELDGVITALTQIASKGKVSAEEIHQLAERLPQIRVAMKNAFGTADTEVLKKMGIGSEEFINKVIAEFERLPPVTGGILNTFENLRDKSFEALSQIGNILAPILVNFIDNALTPMLGKIGELANAFNELPQFIQIGTLGFVAFVGVVGPALAIGSKLIAMTTSLGPLIAGLAPLAFHPVTLAVVALTAAITVLYLEFNKLTAAARENDKVFANWVAGLGYARTAKDVAESIRKIEEAQDNNLGATKESAEALKLLKERQKELQANDFKTHLDDMGVKVTVLTSATKTALNVNDAFNIRMKSLSGTVAATKATLAEATAEYNRLGKGTDAASKQAGVVADAYAKWQAATSAVAGAHEKALVPALLNAQHAMASFKFGDRGIESAVLVAELKKAEKGHDDYIAAVVKAGGVTQYAAQEAAKLAEAYRLLDSAPGMDGLGQMTAGVHALLNATLPIDPAIKAINDSLARLGVADQTVGGKATTITQLENDLIALDAAVQKGIIDNDVYNRGWINLIHQMDRAGKAIDPADRRRLIELEKQYGGQIKQTAAELAETANAAARAARRSGEEMKRVGREFQRAFNNLTSNAIDGLFEGGKVMKNIVTDLSKNMLQIFAGMFFNKLKLMFADMLVDAGGSLGKLGGMLGGIAKPGKAAADAATTAAGTATTAAGTVATTANTGAGAGTPAATAGSQLGSIVNMVTGAVTAISSVIGNFQMKGINKSLDLIEKATRFTEIYIGGQADSLLATSHLMLTRLTDLAASMRGAVKINLDGKITDEEANNLISNLLNGSQNFYSETYGVFLKILQALNSGFATLTGQMHLMVESQPKLWERITGSIGSILGGIGGAAAGGLGNMAGGLVSGLVGGLISGIGSLFGSDNEGMTEVNTRMVFAEVANLRADEWQREGHLMTKLDDIWHSVIHLADWGRLTVSKFDEFVIPDLQRIAGALQGGAIAGGGGATFEFNNCTFGAGTSRESIDAMFQAGYRRAKSALG